MKVSASKAILLLGIFFVLVLGIAFRYNPHFPVRVIAGEQSAGTWLSGVLLIIMASMSLVISMRQRWYPWLLLAMFFLLLALDERFMFHEQLKEHIIFSSYADWLPRWAYELPVIIGGCLGGLMAFALWRNLPAKSRVLLLVAVVMGTASVVIDILAGGVVLEECLKLVAELLVVCVLVSRVAE
jgi:hypothetical protein